MKCDAEHRFYTSAINFIIDEAKYMPSLTNNQNKNALIIILTISPVLTKH